MSIERENRTGHNGGPLWRMDIGDRDARRDRRLILEPRTCPHPDRAAELHTWVEDRVGRYHWVSTTADAPRNPPTFAVDDIEVANTRRTNLPKQSLEYVVIKALACSELHGESAKTAIHNLFWMHFVEDDDGLAYLCKHAAPDTGSFYARERLLRYIRVDDRETDNYSVKRAIEKSMATPSLDGRSDLLATRFAKRTATDRNLRDAIVALLKTGEPEEVQLAHIRQIVELNATRMDYVIAGIVSATQHGNALLGLRACQRLDRGDAAFFDAVDAFVIAHPDGKGLAKFLRPHCEPVKPPKPKLAPPEDEDEDDCDE